MAKALKRDGRDNCAVLLTDVKAGDPVEVSIRKRVKPRSETDNI